MTGRMRTRISVSAAAAVATLFSGCVTLESAGQRQMQHQQEQRLTRQVAALQQHNTKQAEELAAVRADMVLVTELRAKVAGLREDVEQCQRDNKALEAQTQELRSIVAALRRDIVAVDTAWRDGMRQLQKALMQEGESRQKSIADVIDAVSVQISDLVTKDKKTTGGRGTYTVMRGDTLSAIAKAFGVSIQSLKDANALKGDLIKEGQELTIPAE